MVLPVSGQGNHLLFRVLGQGKGPQGLIRAKKVPESGLPMVTSHQGATPPQFGAGSITQEEDLVYWCSLELHPAQSQQQRGRGDNTEQLLVLPATSCCHEEVHIVTVQQSSPPSNGLTDSRCQFQSVQGHPPASWPGSWT